MGLNNPPELAGIEEQLDDAAAAALVVKDTLHNRERWMSKLASPAGNKVAEQGLTPFVADSGNNDWGVGILICDTADTPVVEGMLSFDVSQIYITDVERATIYCIRFIWGLVDAATAEAAGDFCEVMFQAHSTTYDRVPLAIVMPIVASGTKIWVKVWNAEDTGTFSFVYGLHEYAVAA